MDNRTLYYDPLHKEKFARDLNEIVDKYNFSTEKVSKIKDFI